MSSMVLQSVLASVVCVNAHASFLTHRNAKWGKPLMPSSHSDADREDLRLLDRIPQRARLASSAVTTLPNKSSTFLMSPQKSWCTSQSIPHFRAALHKVLLRGGPPCLLCRNTTNSLGPHQHGFRSAGSPHHRKTPPPPPPRPPNRGWKCQDTSLNMRFLIFGALLAHPSCHSSASVSATSTHSNRRACAPLVIDFEEEVFPMEGGMLPSAGSQCRAVKKLRKTNINSTKMFRHDDED